MSTGRPLRLAHRGDDRRAPENTLAALLAATAVPGCDGVEFDVRSAADGVPVLVHDETLERVQGRPERVAEVPADRLRSFGLATLDEALAALPAGAFLDVELKNGVDLRPVVESLERRRGPGLAQAMVSGFDLDTLEGIGRLRPAWPRWLNAHDLGEATVCLAVELGCVGIAADWRAIDERTARRVRDAGLDLAAWTVRRRPTYERLARLGVAAICVEGPALDG